MVKYQASAADVLDEWIEGEREFLSYVAQRQSSFLESAKNGQNDGFKRWADKIAEHLATLATSETPFPLKYRTGERKYPISVIVSYKDFLQTICDNQTGLMAAFISPPEETPDNLEPYVSKLRSQTTFGHPYLQGYPTDEQTEYYKTLCEAEAVLFSWLLEDRIHPSAKSLIDRSAVLLKRTAIRVTEIKALEDTLENVAKGVTEQKVAFGVTRRGITYRVYNPRKWKVGYTPTQEEALHYISTARAAEMWKTLTYPQRRPFTALAFGQRLVEWMRQPAPKPAAAVEPLPNTLNKGYLRFLVEYYRHWQRTNLPLPPPVENLIRVFYPNKEPAGDLFMLIDCEGYYTPDFVEHVDELGKVLKSATCPHLDGQIIHFLPFGLGCQHWQPYGSKYLGETLTVNVAPVVAHDFRLREKKTEAWIYSQDPRKWTYTGEWPQITRYLGDFADMRVIGWQPWNRSIEVEIWRGNENKFIEVFWGRRFIGHLETKGQFEQPTYALARFIVHYKNYHDFDVEISWWYLVKPPEFIPIFLEEWSILEPPEMELVFTEEWSEEEEGPPEMALLMLEIWGVSGDWAMVIKEAWSYMEPPEFTKVWTENWSS